MGLEDTPATDPLFLGMLGMHGTYEANMAMQELRCAARRGRTVRRPRHRQSAATSPVQRKIIHIDIDPSSIPSASRSMSHRRNVSDVLEDV